MTVTYHRSKERAENRRYSMLLALRDGPRNSLDIAAEMGIHQSTAWRYANELTREELIERSGAHNEILSLTAEGQQRAAVVQKQAAPVQRYPCGHPVAPSTNFCLKCHQIKHKKALGIRVRMTAAAAPSA